jgi:ankyrin repeat protein
MHQDGMTALMLASGLGDYIMVVFLLTKGANIELHGKVRNAVCLLYPSKQKIQLIEYCIAAAT